MAEGFAAVDYVTNLRLSEVGSKRLWLVRVPRHMETTRLEGTKLKLPGRKSREGKVLGRAAPGDEGDDDRGVAEREAFVLRAADAAESRGFRALFSTEEDDKLSPASLFAGQVNVSIGSHASEEVSVGDKIPVPTVMAALVEPYQGRPQLKGMRVRAKLAGAGTEYSRSRPLADRQLPAATTPSATVKREATVDRETTVKKEATVKREEAEKEVKADEAKASRAFEGSHPETPKTSKKKNKRKSAGTDGAVKAVKEEWREGSASTTKKPKNKNRKRLSV